MPLAPSWVWVVLGDDEGPVVPGTGLLQQWWLLARSYISHTPGESHPSACGVPLPNFGALRVGREPPCPWRQGLPVELQGPAMGNSQTLTHLWVGVGVGGGGGGGVWDSGCPFPSSAPSHAGSVSSGPLCLRQLCVCL